MGSMRVRVASIAVLIAVLVGSGLLVGCTSTPSTSGTGTSVTPSTGTSEGAEGQNVQGAPGEESSSVEATTVP